MSTSSKLTNDNVLKLTKGSVDPFTLAFPSDNLSGVTDYSFNISESHGGTSILSLTKAAGLALVGDIITASLSQGQADALPLGTWIGEVAIKDKGVWRHTRPFTVKIATTQAPTS